MFGQGLRRLYGAYITFGIFLERTQGMEQITASTAIAFCIGMVISGIVSFLVCSCIVAEERYDKTKVWADGYTAGYTDGAKEEVSAV